MPPKGKCGKKLVNSTNTPIKSNESNTSNNIFLTPELEQQFEVELGWCIQQLQVALKSGKLNNKQVQDNTKALNILMSNSTPLVHKRQVMRLSFGDYRAKMSAEEKKCSKNAVNMKIKLATPSKKSIFVKKSKVASSENVKLSKTVQNIKIESGESSHQCQKDFTFVPSNNSFRFGFDSDS